MPDRRIPVCVDFDGTCVIHAFPKVGHSAPGAVETLQHMHATGADLILFTMRSGEYLDAARAWFIANKIPLYGIQTNPSQKEWTDSPKAYGHYFIDDAAVGCPLVQIQDIERPVVDWGAIREWWDDPGRDGGAVHSH